jgi:hypothetical protein
MSGPSSGKAPSLSDEKADLTYIHMLMETQHNSMIQSQQDCAALAERMTRFKEASAQCITRLEEAIMLLSTKREDSANRQSLSSAPPPSGRIDLQRFRNADGPIYTGPFHDVEEFLKWMNAVQFFFASKGVSHDSNKIRIIGSLIWEFNVLSFYSNHVDTLVELSWTAFKSKLFGFALPPLWCTTLRDQLRDFRMCDTEAFSSFSTRARTLQTIVNFEGGADAIDGERSPTIPDLELAEAVLHGLPAELKALVKNHQVLLTRPF